MRFRAPGLRELPGFANPLSALYRLAKLSDPKIRRISGLARLRRAGPVSDVR
jgi:hypothetical protein